ncbi:MAG: PAS domain S-box protein [bacterium]
MPGRQGFDVTDSPSARAEYSAQASAERLRYLIESSEDIIFSMTRDGVYTAAGGRRLAEFGITPEEIVGKSIWELDPENADWYQDRHLRVLETGEPITYEHEYTFNGVTRTDQTTVYPIKDGNGAPIEVGIICRDITKRREAEEKLRDSEAEKALILRTTAELIVYYDRDLKVNWLNATAAESTGKSAAEARGRYCYEVFHDRTDPCPNCPIVKTRDTGEPQMAETIGPDGRIWLLRSYPARNGSEEVVGVVEYGLDITARRRTEQHLRSSEERFRAIIENSPIGLYQTTPDGRIMMANQSILDMLHYSDFESLAARDLNREGYEPEGRREQFMAAIERDGKVIGLESAWRRRDGSTVFVRESARAVRDDSGQTLYYEGTVEDITERKLSEEKYLKLVETSTDAIQIFDAESGAILETNPAGCEMYGFTLAEFQALTIFDITAEEEKTRSALGEAIKGDLFRIPLRYHRRKNGKSFPVEISVATFSAGGRLLGCSIIREISERVKAEAAQREASTRLRHQSRELLEKNVTLRQVLGHLEEERASYRQKVATSLSEVLSPYLAKLQTSRTLTKSEIEELRGTLELLTSGNQNEFRRKYETLSPRETEICEYVAEGFSSKEIAASLHLSPATVHKHRELIRHKLDIQNSKVNLATYLRLRKPQ